MTENTEATTAPEVNQACVIIAGEFNDEPGVILAVSASGKTVTVGLARYENLAAVVRTTSVDLY